VSQTAANSTWFEAIRAIGLDQQTSIIRASTGLNVSELLDEGLIGLDDRQIMMQWGMEAFSNPEVIDNSICYSGQNDMFDDKFVQGFPHCVQHENIVLSLYDLVDPPGFLEQEVADFTHAYSASE
jgi:hypothetical protein